MKGEWYFWDVVVEKGPLKRIIGSGQFRAESVQEATHKISLHPTLQSFFSLYTLDDKNEPQYILKGAVDNG